jgi:hypothetical protein
MASARFFDKKGCAKPNYAEGKDGDGEVRPTQNARYIF